MKIFYVPIETLPNRYTADWVEQFCKEFDKAGVSYEVINNRDSVINNGSVLDAYDTSLNKLSQLNQLINYIKQGIITSEDVILFADAWFPGLESLLYIRNITNVEFKMAGIYHAGSWDPYDFTSRTGMREWAQHLELSWLNGLDMIFVATQFHKDLIIMNSGVFNEDKIFVTGIPFYSKELQYTYPILREKENIVVFPHRKDLEKHPEKFENLKRKYPQWRFVYTLDETNSREEYFNLLAKSKVMISFAQQETFGYSTVESMALGNYVIVPNKLSYREVVPDKNYRYNKEKEIPKMLETFMASQLVPEYECLNNWRKAIPNMLKVINFKIREFARIRKEQEEAIHQEQLRIAKEREEARLARLEAKEEKK